MKDRKFPNLNPDYEHLVLIVEPHTVKKKKRISVTDESIFKPAKIVDEYRHTEFSNAMYQLEIDAKLRAGKK